MVNINRMHKINEIKKHLSNSLGWVFAVPCFSCFAAQALRNAWALGFCVGSPKNSTTKYLFAGFTFRLSCVQCYLRPRTVSFW